MALIDELKEWRTATSAEMDRLEAAGREIDQKWKEQERLFGDLDTAIRALDPLDPPTDEEMFGDSDFEAEKAVAREQLEREPEIPAGFTKWEGGEMPAEIDGVAVDYIMTGDGRAFSSDAAFLRWARNGDPDDIIAYRIIEASPAPDPDEQDDASEFAEPMPDPEFVVLDEQTCEPVEEAPALNEAMQDERELTAQNDYDTTGVLTADDMQGGAMPNFAEYPAPVTEGYAPVVDAPVTNPEADALARAHDWYSPEKVAERNKFNPWGIFGKKLEDA